MANQPDQIMVITTVETIKQMFKDVLIEHEKNKDKEPVLSPVIERDWMYINEVAMYFDKNEKTIGNWADRGYLNRRHLPSGQPIFDKEEVLNLHNQRENKVELRAA